MPITPRVYRLRRTAGVSNGHVLVAEADVYGFSDTFVLIAAREGRVRHWRNITDLGISKNKVRPRYQFIAEIPIYEANSPRFPTPTRHD